ncbi:hypothetical protein [Paenibacillus naphthalenovorans]|uniref:hypothetical protein n=1 Tax=Paenibacillus naphthalenovorans TaxID=162209 RepID=UPI003D277B0C
MGDSNDKISADIAVLRERLRQHRIERGLPPEPRERKKNLRNHVALVLFDRLEKFADICIEIARLYRAGHFVYIDMQRFSKYRRDARLLGRSKEFDAWMTGMKVSLILAKIRSINEQIEAGYTDLESDGRVLGFYKSVLEFKDGLPHAKNHFKYFLGREPR